ncbi:hypothetical protein BDZ89DRAFT_1076716 [Hymenopellis radicata]|nr:hypothetical protein BDZ89DRAFT_1076716 [Hymenopellis radicata]
MPEWYLEDNEAESPYTSTTCSNVRKLDTKSVLVIDALTLPHLREASLHPNAGTVQNDTLYSFKRLLIRSNCLNALTRLSLSSVPLAASPEHGLHSILSQTHSLAFLDLDVCVQEFDEQTDVNDLEQILTIVKFLEVIPTKTITFLPLLSSLDIQIDNHGEPDNLPYFGPLGSFASAIKARWKGDDTVGLARLRTCHFAVHARSLQEDVYRAPQEDQWSPEIFNEAERFIFHQLIDDGMDFAILVTARLTESVGGIGEVFAVSG